jgi:F-type H+-transporting ATPase subunit epsilon
MASTIRLELVTPERLLVSEDVDEVIAPGYEGEFGVLPEHTHLLAILSIGILRYRKGSETRKVAIGGGFAEITPERAVVMADAAEKSEEIDVERARRAQVKAEAALEAALKEVAVDDEAYVKASTALQRAQVRIAAAGPGS